MAEKEQMKKRASDAFGEIVKRYKQQGECPEAWEALKKYVDIPVVLKGHKEGVYAVAIWRDGEKIVSGSFDNTVRVWNAETCECEKTLVGHAQGVFSVAVSPFGGGMIVSGSSDRTLWMWNFYTGECTGILKGHTDVVNAVAISPDGFVFGIRGPAIATRY